MAIKFVNRNKTTVTLGAWCPSLLVPGSCSRFFLYNVTQFLLCDRKVQNQKCSLQENVVLAGEQFKIMGHQLKPNKHHVLLSWDISFECLKSCIVNMQNHSVTKNTINMPTWDQCRHLPYQSFQKSKSTLNLWLTQYPPRHQRLNPSPPSEHLSCHCAFHVCKHLVQAIYKACTLPLIFVLAYI